MIIVAGRIHVRPGFRAEFLELSMDAMKQARRTRGCIDFVVSADPLEADRVNVFEQWTDREALEEFRQSGPEDEMSSLIMRAAVDEHEVSS